MTTPDKTPFAPTPVCVLTGFLGAGKTTLLNGLLKHDGMAQTAVIINEFGEISLDHLLVETADENVFEMASGCLCCTIRGDLADTLNGLLEKRNSGAVNWFERIVIETTGLADPAPVLHTIMNHPYLVAHCRLSGVVTVIDAVNGSGTLDRQVEAVKQVAVADRLVITKTDLMGGPEGAEKLVSLKQRLKELNPAAGIFDVAAGEAALKDLPEKLFDGGLYDPSTKNADVAGWLRADAYDNPASDAHSHKAHDQGGHDHGSHDHGSHDHGAHGHGTHSHGVNRHDDHIRAFSIASDRAISSWGLELFLELLTSYHGPNLLRVKGIVRLEEDEERPLVIHGVQHIFHPPAQLEKWPDEDRRSRLVFITRDIERQELDRLFSAFTDPVRGGADAFRDDTLSLRRGDR